MVGGYVHPVVSVPRHALTIGRLVAVLIAGDLATGQAKRLPAAARYRTESRDRLEAPSEATLEVDCDVLVRSEGAFWGTHVGVMNSPSGGWHLFLFDGETIRDPSVERGMAPPPPEAYAGAVRVPIERPHGEPDHAIANGAAAVVVRELVANGATDGEVRGPAHEAARAAAALSVRAAELGLEDRLDELAVQTWIALPEGPERRAVAAVAAVASRDPGAVDALRRRFASTLEGDAGDVARLLAAVVVLAKRGHAPAVLEINPPARIVAVAVPEPPPWMRVRDTLTLPGTCPGTCAVR